MFGFGDSRYKEEARVTVETCISCARHMDGLFLIDSPELQKIGETVPGFQTEMWVKLLASAQRLRQIAGRHPRSPPVASRRSLRPGDNFLPLRVATKKITIDVSDELTGVSVEDQTINQAMGLFPPGTTTRQIWQRPRRFEQMPASVIVYLGDCLFMRRRTGLA